MNNKKYMIILSACVALCFASCVSPKEVVYLQDAQPGVASEKLAQNYQTTIQKDDQLRIAVSSKQPELTAPFSFAEMKSADGTSNSGSAAGGYPVDANGDIVLPIIGKMHAAGKTCAALASDVATALRKDDYIKDATVSVQITNAKFSVLGEVNHPGTFMMDGERLTVLEAISKAGDLSIDGNRSVSIVREINGKREMATLDLRSKELFNSPFYYIQQNDVIYVSPSDRKVNTRSDAAQWYGWGLSGAALIMAIIACCAA